MKFLKADSHTHPYEKGKSKEAMRAFAEEAINKGFDEICFTEHGELLPGRNADEFAQYAEFAIELKEEFKSVKIKLGIELDYHPEMIRKAERIISSYPFDYVLGSVHVHTALYSKEIAGMAFKEAGATALENITGAVKSGIFDTISHLDFFRILDLSIDFKPDLFEKEYREVFEAMSKCNVCLEINSSSLRRPFNDLHPSPLALKWAKEYPLHYTFGSDAHQPEYVGCGYENVLAALTSEQKKRLVTFEKREMVYCAQ